MKKIFGFILIGIGILIPGAKGKQSVKNNAQQIKVQDTAKESISNQNFTQEEEQKEIQKRLKGLGYFQ